jgi:hypothetical protein
MRAKKVENHAATVALCHLSTFARVHQRSRDKRMFLPLLAAAVFACVIGFVLSVVINWASGKSALWNMGFAAALVLGFTGMALLAIVIVMRRFSN